MRSQVQSASKSIQLCCVRCDRTIIYEKLTEACPYCGYGILKPQYDLANLSDTSWTQILAHRSTNLWRYHELLPIYDLNNIVSLGEGWTPLIHAKKLGELIGLKHLYIKDERQNPTSSFKDRQATVAISMLCEQHISEIVLASTGNVAIAYSAYAAKAKIRMWAFFPRLVPEEKIREVAVYGTKIIRIDGTYDEAKVAAAEFAQSQGYFLDKGVKTFAGIESMKTLAFEIAEQMDWRSPDWYIQAVSGGMGPIGVIKGFEELASLNLIDKIPSIGAIQSTGCAPMVKAFKQGYTTAQPVHDPATEIATLSTGDPGVAYEVLFKLMGQYGGAMEDATDAEAYATTLLLASSEGISVEPATAVAFAGLIKLANQEIIKADEVVVINCTGHTYPVEPHIVRDRLPT